MDLAFILLAESAIAHEGSFFAHGGGVNYLRSPSFPCTIASITLVASIRVYPGEFEAPHNVSIRGIAPDGASFFEDFNAPFLGTPIAGRPDLPGDHIIAFNQKQLQLRLPGSYTYVLSADGLELGRVSFICDHVPAIGPELPQNI
jgi:hypothetical protein